MVSVEPLDGAFVKPVTVSVPCPAESTAPGKPPPKLRLIAGTTGYSLSRLLHVFSSSFFKEYILVNFQFSFVSTDIKEFKLNY